MHKEQNHLLEQTQFETLIQGLVDNNYGCIDDFLTTEIIEDLRNNIRRLSNSDDLKTAGVGNKSGDNKNSLIRNDKTKWIENDTEFQYEILLLQKIANFIKYLNKTCYTSINKFESHYANYEKESFYKRHLDQFQSDNGWEYSLILYLNEDWKNEDGGLLSLCLKNGVQKDISPMGGRLMFFKSDEMEHEAHTCFTRNRISIAGWIKS